MKKFFILVVCLIGLSLILTTRIHAEIAGPALNSQVTSIQVDPSSGSAVLPIQIPVPPGRGGIEPNVALVYNSRGEETYLGVGWNLEFGSIERSTKFGIPNYDATDTFILNQGGGSQELVYNSASGLYVSTIEGSFMRIQQIGNYWLVTDKKGVKYYYGQTDLAKEYDLTQTSRISKWALERVEDAFGNFMNLTYRKDGNRVLPASIAYTGNTTYKTPTYATVSFGYASLPEDHNRSSFRTGFRIDAPIYLTNIRVSAPNGQTPQYFLNYQTSFDTHRKILTSITSTAYDGQTLPAITFTYQSNQGATTPSYNLVNSFDGKAYADNIWNAKLAGGFDRGNDNFGPTPGFDVDKWFDFSQATGSWANGQWNTDNKAKLTFSSNQDSANVFYTYVFVSTAKTLNVPFISQGIVGVYLNGDYKNSVGNTWSLKQGMNLIMITAYNQNQAFNFDLNYNLADNVDYVISTQGALPKVAGDFNGDGILDIGGINASLNGIYVATSNGAAFAPAQTWISGLTFTNQQVQAGDFNGDGLSDIVIFDPTGKTCRVLLSNGTSFRDAGIWLTGFGSNNVQFSVGDFDGDGITDIGSFYKDATSLIHLSLALSKKVRFEVNNPDAADYLGPVGDVPLFFGDFNNDGLTDIGAYKTVSGGLTVLLNTGNKTKIAMKLFTNAGAISANQNIVPSDFQDAIGAGVGYYDTASQSFAIRNFIGMTFSWGINKKLSAPPLASPYVIQSADFNGDGLRDLSFYNEQGDVKTFFSNEKYPDLMVSVTNGLGSRSTVDYDTCTHCSNKLLPFILQVVNAVTVTDNLGHSYRTNYAYTGAQWDAQNREFDGFQTVTVTDPDGNHSVTTFDQRHFYRGRPIESNAFDVNNRLLSKSVNQWGEQNVTSDGISKFIFQKRSDNFVYEGGINGKRTAQLGTYNNYGDAIQTVSLGEVDLLTGNDIGSDDITTLIDYSNNTTTWLIGIPRHTITKDNGGNILSQGWFYYDNATNNEDIPSKGLMTKRLDWNGSAQMIDSTYTYDGIGNLLSTTDAKGNSNSIIYDNTYLMFPVQTTNALGQTSKSFYFGVNDTGINTDPAYNAGLRGLWGQTMAVIDANGQKAFKSYDSFGRLVKAYAPLDSFAYPTMQTIYTISPTYTKVKTQSRINSNQAATIDTVDYYDGLGRMIQSKSNAATAGQYVVSNQKTYNSRGLVEKAYIPRFTTNNLDTIDIIADDTIAHGTMYYDALGRKIRSVNADGTYANIVYDTLSVTTFDESGHKAVSYFDVLGKLIKKEEYTGSDGRDSNYPNSPYAVYATTTYQYDTKGNLTKVVDAKGNITTITYDAIGRKISMDDPDMHHWSYTYDNNGNLLTQQDAKNQIINFKYDKLNRLINKSDAANSFNVTYNYDDITQAYGIGSVGSVSYDNGQAKFTYDQIGREASSSKVINAINYNVSRKYDALNRIKELQYPNNSKVIYNYNAAGQVDSVKDSTGVGPQSRINPTHKFDIVALIGKYVFGVAVAEAATEAVEEAAAQTAACNPNAPLVFNTTSPANNSTYTFTGNNSVNLMINVNWSLGCFTSPAELQYWDGTKTRYCDKFNGAANQFSCAVNNLQIGNYSFVVKYYDGGLKATTAPVNVTVIPPVPTISLTAPVNNAIYTAPTNISLTADIGSSTNVSKIEFYSGATLLATSTTITNKTYTWANPAPGSYALTAKVYNGTTVTSAPVNIKVLQPTPSVTLTAPANNASYTAPSSITLSANATVAYGTFSKVEFYNGTTLLGVSTSSPYTYTWSNPPVGSFSLFAKGYVNGVAASSSVANVTVSAVNVAPSVSLSSPANNTTAVAPASFTISANASDTDGIITKVDFYNGTTLLNSDTTIPFSYTWANVASGNYVLTAKATDNSGAVSTSTAVNVTVTAPANKAPTVNITSPLNIATFTAPASITINANATDSDGTISKVDFYHGTTLLGTDTTSPYSYAWSNVTAGTYVLTAKATDNSGAVTTSTAVNATVTAPANVPPTVSITSPSNNATLTAPANIMINANATDSDGTISKVDFYNGTTLLGTDTTSPYSFTWSNVSIGNYVLTAKATDNSGAISTSTAVNLIVTVAPKVPPTVSITSPTNNVTLTAPVSITINASVTFKDSTISKVDFYNGTTLLGSDTTYPYSYTWSKVPLGNYNITAQATDSAGLIGVSTPVNVTVATSTAPDVLPSINLSSNITSGPSQSAIVWTATLSPTSRSVYVSFYLDGQYVAGVNSSPYIFTLENASQGTYNMVAKVIDYSGGVVASNPVIVNIYNPAIAVNITNPTNYLNVTAPTSLPIDVSVVSTNSTISKVDFYNGTTLLGTDTTYPYSYTWSNVAVGNYLITAKATDSGGAVGESKPVNVTVTAATGDVLPSISLSSNITEGPSQSTVIWTATLSPTTRSVYVAFYLDGRYVGGVNQAPYTFTLINADSGPHTMVAKVVDISSNKAESNPVTVNIASYPPIVMMVGPPANMTVQAPGSFTINVVAFDIDGTVSKVDFYNGTTLLGTDTTSPYSYEWTSVPAGNYTLTAKATDNTGVVGEATPLNVSVTGPVNIPPTVNITSPTNNATLTAPASITINANATDSDGTITKVDFYNGTTLLGTDTTSPYTYSWSNVAVGNYALTAKATDNSGAETTSTVVNAIVTAPVNVPPTVNITSPTNNTTLIAPASITINVNAADSDGTITKVDFYNGTTLLGTDTTSPYSYVWSVNTAGTYVLTAKATDNRGAITTSTGVNVIVAAVVTYIKRIDYNALGQKTQIQYGNGTITTNTYDPLNFRLKRIYTVNAQNNKIQDLNYTYDNVGNILSITDNVNTATQTYSYDALNRLKGAQGGFGNRTYAYAYDQIGNITQKDGLTYTYGGNGAGPHAVTGTSDGTKYAYDANGNMVGKTTSKGVWTYVYDSQNRLTNIGYAPGLKPAKTIAQYAYDGDGARTKKVVYRYLDTDYNNSETHGLLVTQIGEPLITAGNAFTTSTTIYVGKLYEIEDSRKTNYIFLCSQRIAAITGSEIDYYHSNHLGSTNVITDNSGLARSLTEYDPFGKIIRFEKYGSKIKNGWQYFSDKSFDDESGLIYFEARYYDPSLGRFITPDTIVQAPSNPQTLNRYTYCNNNPVNLIDPSGHSWFKKFFGQIAGAITGAVAFVLSGFNPIVGMSVYNGVAGGVTAAINGANIGQAIGIGLISGATGYFTGGIAQGAATGFLNSGFWGNVIGGSLGGASGSAAGAALTGGNIGRAALAGAVGGAIGGMMPGFGAIPGGAASSAIMGRDPVEGAVGGSINLLGSLAGNSIASGSAPPLNVDGSEDIRIKVLVGSRPVGGLGGLLGFRHRFVQLPDGRIIEMGPGAGGKIQLYSYQNRPESRSLGSTPMSTMDAINNNPQSVRWSSTFVGQNSLDAAINTYGKVNINNFYNAASHNSNNAVNTIISSSRGSPSDNLGYTPGFPNW